MRRASASSSWTPGWRSWEATGTPTATSRYTFCTWMTARHPIQVVPRLVRHGTITLTADLYNDLNLTDTAEQQWALPHLFPTASPTAGQQRPEGRIG